MTPPKVPTDDSALPYLVPMGTFLALTSLEGMLPARYVTAWYPWLYTLKVSVVAGLAWVYRSTWNDLKPLPGVKGRLAALVLGVLVALFWVLLDGHYPQLKFMGSRTAFDPNVLAIPLKGLFLIVRMLGLVLLVPLIEELFWRSFLWRWVIDVDIQRVPIGRVSPLSVLATSVLFGLAHPEWLPGFLTGLVWAWLLGWTKSVSACVLSHAVANLALGVYVIVTGDWKFW